MEIQKNTKPKSIKRNFVFNLIYHIITVIIPIILTPYLSRTLLSFGIGQYSFSYSIASYFIVLANFGFTHYSQREIAKYQGNNKMQSIIFYEILILKIIISFISTFLYVGIIQFSLFKEYKLLLYIMIPQILSVGFDITFLFSGNEDFKELAIRNSLIKILTVVCIFVFVKNSNHLWLYALINSLGAVLSALVFFLFARKYIVRVKINELNIIRHLKPTFKLFIPALAINMYSILDRSMLGFMITGNQQVLVNNELIEKKISDIEIGNYDQAEKIIKLITTFIFAYGDVLMPRNALNYKNKRFDDVKETIYKAVRFCYFLALPSALGISLIANNFSPWFFGDGYDKVPNLLIIFSPFILFSSLNYIFGNQYLVATNKDNIYTKSVLFGVITNIILNFLLIKKFMSYGSAVASVASELVILVYQLYKTKNDFNLKRVFGSIIKYFDASLIMFLVALPLSLYLKSSIINTLIIVIVGVVTYYGLLLLFREEFSLSIVNKLKYKAKKVFHFKLDK